MSDQIQLGIVLLKKVENEKAIEIFKKALEKDSNNPVIYRHLGLAYFNIGNYSEAINSWNRCLDLEPGHHQTWWNLGQLHESLSDFKRAFHAYLKAETTARNEPTKASRYKEWVEKTKRKISKQEKSNELL